MIPTIEVKQIDSKTYGLYIDNQLIGTAKLDCDARMQMHYLQKKFKEVSEEAYRNGEESGSIHGI